jgi:hypothetical protein
VLVLVGVRSSCISTSTSINKQNPAIITITNHNNNKKQAKTKQHNTQNTKQKQNNKQETKTYLKMKTGAGAQVGAESR